MKIEKPRLLQVLKLTLFYTLAFTLIVAAYRAAMNDEGEFKINFEYRVF